MSFVLSAGPVWADSSDLKSAARIPILHDGRVKSLDVFSREWLRAVTTKDTWQKQPALDLILTTAGNPDALIEMPMIRVDHLALKQQLKLDAQTKYFSYSELKDAYPVLLNLVQSADAKRDRDERPTAIEQKAELTMSRLQAVDKLAAGDVLTVIPPENKGGAWLSPFLTADEHSQEFFQLMEAYASKDADAFVTTADRWTADVNKHLDAHSIRAIYLENMYYAFKPFLASMALYLAAFVLLLFRKRVWIRTAGFIALASAIGFHLAGLTMRCLILGRPPVSNMYESMIFMSAVLTACAVIYFAINRRDFILRVAAIAGALVMVYADLLPIESSLGVLVPVLRSNYWLTIHVMTIVASYGIFGLAMALAHRQLFLTSLGKMGTQDEANSAQIIDRLIQAGVIVLGIGTVLGGVWANESWGRFWGWDPKETWAFITFLGYIVIVHLRARGRLSHFGLALGAIAGFLLVLMTWYGVNFLLGRGLHSYGSGSGGVMWIFYFLIFEVVFSVFITVKRFKFI